MSAPAGWYPDPADATRTRWWDGAQWTTHQQQPARAYAYPQTPAYPAKVDVPTTTVWIWLGVACALVPFLTVFLIDWNGYIDAMVASAGGAPSVGGMLQWELKTLALSLVSWGALAAFIVFAWLDWRELNRRGVAAPFHWAWGFFALLTLGAGVYVIGRAVILGRRTRQGGRAPMWVWIVGTVVGYLILTVWMFEMFSTILSRLIGTYA